jgi:hypothetical protein
LKVGEEAPSVQNNIRKQKETQKIVSDLIFIDEEQTDQGTDEDIIR